MDYIGEVGFNALHAQGITYAFKTLDVNGDHKIDKSDAYATSDTKVKSEINSVLNQIKKYDRFSEHCGFSTDINFSNPNLYKEFPELAAIVGYDESAALTDEDYKKMGLAGSLLKAMDNFMVQPKGVLDEQLNAKWGNPEGVTETPHFAGYDVEYEREFGSRQRFGNTTSQENTTDKESVQYNYSQIQLAKKEKELKKAQDKYDLLESEIDVIREEYYALTDKINYREENKEDTFDDKEEAKNKEYNLKYKDNELQKLKRSIDNLNQYVNLYKSST